MVSQRAKRSINVTSDLINTKEYKLGKFRRFAMLKTKISILALAFMSLGIGAQPSVASLPITKAVTSDIAKTQFVKSPQDDRVYSELMLENGMQVVVISDPSINESAVSLSVGVGQFHDPDNYQGLAHFLEHMIFQGSKSYPEPNELIDFVAKHNGRYNAMTEAQLTSYFFSIPSQQFDPALVMLSDAIANPLFKQVNIDKELNAIEQEWQRLRQQDMYVINRALANTVNPSHPIKKFGAGNKASLENKTESISLYDAMKRFYEQYYSSNIMTLTLVSNQPIKELEKIARKHFSKVKNRNVANTRITDSVLTSEALNKEIKLRTKIATDILMLQFPLQNNFTTWQNKPNAYLNMMLSSQEPGSLAALLIEQELIQMVSPLFLPNAYGSEGTALIQFVLTEKGEQQKDKVIAAFFDYIALLKQKGITPEYAQELAQMLEGQFNNFQKPSALQLAMQFSRMMHTVSAKDILHFDTYFSEFNSETVQRVIDQFTADNMRIWHISDDEEVDTPLTYADGSYSIAQIEDKKKALFANSGYEFKLHEPEIERELETQQLVASSDKPKQLINDKGLSAWLKTSEHFKQKQGVIGISIESEILNNSAKNHALTNLLSVMMLKDLQRLGTRAQQRHQVGLMLLQNANGNLAVNVVGKTAKHDYYASKLFEAISEMKFKKSRFNSAKKLYRESLENLDKLPLTQQSELYFGQLVKTEAMHWSAEEILKQIEEITLEELVAFHEQLMSQTYIDLFAFGQYGEKQIRDIAVNVRKIFGETTRVSKPINLVSYQPKEGTAINKKVNSTLDNAYLRESYIYPQESMSVLASLKVINQLFNSAIYKSLRTEKQMAYAVGSRAFRVHKFPAFSLYMESADVSLPKIKSEFDDFVVGFYKGLELVSEQDIAAVKQGLIEELKQKPENIFVESQPYFSDWLKGEYHFSSRAELEKQLKKLNKQQVLDVYKRMLLEYQSETVLLQIKGDSSVGNYFEFSK